MIYFDHSATTPVEKEVLDAMLPYLKENFGNASSIHSFGQDAIAGVDNARDQVAEFLGCEAGEVVFTSGATESNNLALRGIIRACQKDGIENPHIITTSIEHDAILEPCADLEEQGVEVTYLPVKENGVVDIEEVKKAIKDNTVLVSVMYVNSEVGSVQPVREIGKIIKKLNDKKYKEWQNKEARLKKAKPRPIYFHTDATQAVNFFDCNVEKLHVDLLSLSAHKIYGPKGVGILYIKGKTKIKGVQLGGHQERSYRSGTLNVPGIVGLGKAISLITSADMEEDNKKLAEVRDYLIDQVNKNIPDIKLNTDRENGTPAHAHFSFFGAEGESILMSLDMEGIAVSTGSACASGSLESSHVLKAMGIKVEDTHCSIRFSMGKSNTKEDVDKLIEILPDIIEKFRKMNPIYKK